MKITIAGASGFVGTNLIEKIKSNFDVRGLSRSARNTSDGVEWVATDLFSLTSTVEALSNTDIAIYLVHSMMPSSRLFQGTFRDTDLLLADNFSRACKKAEVKQIIYLGGIVPSQNISGHLASRQEVESVLSSSGIPVTVLRAGMVVGDGGSSFEILKNLVLNLPLMVLPKWTSSQTQVIYIEDLIDVIIKTIDNPDYENKVLNVVTGEQIDYKHLLYKTAEHFHRNIHFIPVPVNYTGLSKRWVQLFGEANYELVSPLVDSLLCDLPTPEIDPLITETVKRKTYESMLKRVSPVKRVLGQKKKFIEDKTVRSIQRLPNPLKNSNHAISEFYSEWLPAKFRYIIKAEKDGDIVTFYFLTKKLPLLILKYIAENEEIDRVKLHIIGGILSKTSNTGWLEFRQVDNSKYTLSSIHGFIPSLPWYIYRLTQAPIHKYVMKLFGKTISNIKLGTPSH